MCNFFAPGETTKLTWQHHIGQLSPEAKVLSPQAKIPNSLKVWKKHKKGGGVELCFRN
jgi:hypothetical protein